MIITCNKCDTRFSLDDALIKPTGTKVRCNQCENVFDVYPAEQGASVGKGEEEISGLELESSSPSGSSSDKLEDEGLEMEPADLELKFDFEEADEESQEVAGGIDLSDEDLDFELELEPKDQSESKEPEIELELSDEELKLELESPEEESEADLSSEAADEEDMFDLDLDLESIETKGTESKDTFFEEEIDISEIEKVLDMEEERSEPEPIAEDMELNLDFDLVEDEETAEPQRVPIEEEGGGIEASQEVEVAEAEEEEEFDIDLTLEGEPETGPRASASVEPKEKPIQVEEEEAVEIQKIEAEPEAPSVTAAKERQAQAQPFDIGTLAEVQEADQEPAFVMASEEPEKRRGSRAFIFLLVVLILAGAGYGAFTLMETKGIKIPFISDFLKPSVMDAGNLKIATMEISSRFIDTANQGRLFVIMGKAKNDYSAARSAIFITAKLYAAGKVLVRSQSVFCGNVLSDLELATLDVETIQKRLQNRSGDNNSGARIEPGKEIPFMVVFSNLPDNLEEFTVEVDGSSPVTP